MELTEATSTSTTTKTCTGCQRVLSTALFTRKKGNRDGLEARCIECRAHARRLSEYDLTPQEYLRMGYAQNWECAICRTPMSELDHGLVVDHDHRTGRVRMLLCREDNLVIGIAREEPWRLRRCAEYTELWKDDYAETRIRQR